MPQCEREAEVARALAGGELSGELLQHAQACAVCREVCAVVKELQVMENSMEEPLPSAASLWWRLNLRMRREKLERAKLPLVWMTRICVITVLLVACLALWRVSESTGVSSLLTIGLLGLAAVALPTMIVLWRWSRS